VEVAGVRIGVQREIHPPGNPRGGFRDKLGDHRGAPLVPRRVTRCRVLVARLGGPVVELLGTPVTVTVLRSREADIVQPYVPRDARGVFDHLQNTGAVVLAGGTDVRPVEVRAFAGRPFARLGDGRQLRRVLDGGVVAETGDHVHRLRQRLGGPTGHVFHLEEPAVEGVPL